MAAGPQKFAQIAEHMGVDCAMLVKTTGEKIMTPAMARRLEAGVGRDDGAAEAR